MTDKDKMREVWDAHDKARNKAWREEPGTFDTLDAFKAGAAWQAVKSVPDAELERLRKDAERKEELVRTMRHLRKTLEKIDKYRLCMSYNDSYFGEPEGTVKRVCSELQHCIDAAMAAEGEKK